MWTKDYECEYLLGDRRGKFTNFAHPEGHAVHDTYTKSLSLYDEQGEKVCEDHRVIQEEDALIVLNRCYS